MEQQTDFPFEVIVGDDCSTDETAAIIGQLQKEYPGKIRTVLHKENVGGVNNAYKFCYPLLTGKYVAICEGDDFWTDPLKLQKQVDFLENNPSYVLSFHRVNNVDEQGNFLFSQQPLDTPKRYQGKEVFHLSIPTLSIVFKKCFDTAPPEIFRVQSCDTFLCGLLATYGNAIDMGFIGASYRTHPGGVYSSKPYIDQVRQGIETRKVMLDSDCFDDQYKAEIRKEITKRKLFYFKYFTKKLQLSNIYKILIA